MALVSDGFTLQVVLIDSGANTAVRRYELVAGTAAQAVLDAADILVDLQALTDAVVSAYSITNRFVENALALPAAGIHVENQALVVVNLEGSAVDKGKFSIPAPVANLFTGVTGPNSNQVNTAYAPLVEFVANYGSLGNNLMTISDGQHADGISRGYRRHIASSKG